MYIYYFICLTVNHFAGARILAVNGQSLERVTHQDAVSVLKNAPTQVELVVSQSAHDMSSFGE